MNLGWLIFILAFFIRFFNLLVLELDLDNYLLEDQKMYWLWSIEGAYLPWGTLPENLLTERMPGAFIFFNFLQWVTNNNLFLVLFFQIIIDSITCLLIYSCVCLINKKYAMLTGVFAVFSPLLITISSQILSDTIFLFIFVSSLLFLLKYYKKSSSLYLLALSGFSLGLSAYVRAATFPLIFLCLPIIFLIINSKGFDVKKSLFSLIIFFICSLIPLSDRLKNNIENYNTLSLTSQSGSHVAYWMVPGVLSINENYNRQKAIEYIKGRVDSEGGLMGQPYRDSNKLLKVSIGILSEQSMFDILYAWSRSSFINVVSSAVLIDNRVRNLEHFSFAEEGKVFKWMIKNTSNKESRTYLFVLLISVFLSLFSFLSLFIGLYYLLKFNYKLGIMGILIIMYFSLLTGPTISPKYCMPFIPILFYLQSVFSYKLFDLFKHFRLKKI